ncbi:rRNA methyltransferase 3B, mitochondrial [Danio rerio]|uniref:Mitochondrial rRNA methyltransferase 3b n=1 Tax=Danio rerio TaxID=7955 RepID=F1QYC8_DANRE|nr:rRNA methyltransferase 3B, mitochondrial [Danio rerio]|eukprot:NP_001157404.1 rRNA methyltransferase 3B, mitochondrial [Danio rerio]
MATRIASMRFRCALFQSALTLGRNEVNIKRYVRRRRAVSGVISVNEPTEISEGVISQTSERSSQHNNDITRNTDKSSIENPVSPNNSQPVQFSHINRQKVINLTSRTRFGEVDGLLYEKLHPGDKSLAKLARIAGSKKLREHQVVLEGKHLVCSALDAGAEAQTLYFSSVDALRELPLDKLRQTNVVKVKMEDAQVWSELDTSQEIIAIFKRPEASRLTFSEEKYGRAVPLTLICDTVRDPGNLGSVLRSAAAAGCHSVLLTKGCVDIWELKVLRAAMGAHFRLPIIPNLTWTDISNHLPKTSTVHVADNHSTTMAKHNDNTTPQKHRRPSDYGWVKGHQYQSKAHDDDDDDDDANDLCSLEDYCDKNSKSLETQLYYTDWVAGHTSLIIGGETHGLSREALQLAERTSGRRLLIPMVDGVDSLNSAIAAGVLLFEGRKQLLSLEKIRV